MVVMKRQHSCYALIFILLLFLLCLLFSPLRHQSLVAPDPKAVLETETSEMKRITFPLSQGRALSFLTGGDGPLTFLLVNHKNNLKRRWDLEDSKEISVNAGLPF